MRHRLVLAVICLTALGLTGCGSSSPQTSTPSHLVVTTTGIVGDAVRQIATDAFQVRSLMGPGIDPHLYKASEGDVRLLGSAAIVFYNGIHLEGKMTDVLVKLARSKPVAAVSEAIPAEQLREPPEFQGQYDPHIWFDVSLFSRITESIERELIALAPESRETLQARARRFRDELLALDRWVEASIATIPSSQRVLVTAHDAFGYFGRRYGIEVVGIQGISTVSEAGLGDVQRVVDLVVARRIPAVFIESSVPKRSIEAVIAACRERGHQVTIGGELYSDSLGPVGSGADTYLGMVRQNVTMIVTKLGGTIAP
jgi:manganese/zinc/iron transport system substrate-binding protein